MSQANQSGQYIEWEPSSSSWLVYDSNGEVIGSTTIEEMTGGELEQHGYSIINSNTNEELLRLSASRHAAITPLPGRRLMVGMETSQNLFNRFVTRGMAQMGHFSFDYTMPDGTTVHMENTAFNMSGLGSYLYIRPGAEGGFEYANAPAGEAGQEDRQLLSEQGYRLATFQEAAERSLAAFLMKQYRDVIKAVAAQTDENGDLIYANESEAAWAIATGNFTDVDLWTRTILPYG